MTRLIRLARMRPLLIVVAILGVVGTHYVRWYWARHRAFAEGRVCYRTRWCTRALAFSYDSDAEYYYLAQLFPEWGAPTKPIDHLQGAHIFFMDPDVLRQINEFQSLLKGIEIFESSKSSSEPEIYGV